MFCKPTIEAMTKSTRRFPPTLITTLTILLLTTALAIGQQPASHSSADTDIVMKAMQDELKRSVEKLQLKDLDKPYFIEYEIADVESYAVTAAFGGLLYASRDRGRGLAVEVRAGGYDFDNEPTGYPTQLVIEDDYNALRHELWLATDVAYRQAVETLARKRAFLKNRTEEEKIPDFSREEPTTVIAPKQTLNVDEKRWERQVREWSAIFREFPAIRQSSVSLQIQLFHKYLINSEGTRVRRPSLLVSLSASAYTQAADGMWLSHGTGQQTTELSQTPTAEQFAAAIRKMASELTALEQAPALNENYLGPALFTGQAAAEMFSQLLAPELCSQRPSIGSQQEDSSSLFNRINRRVLPPFLSVFDDPTQQKFAEQSLLGAFPVDDQGVMARKVSLVEEGILKNLLMSRRPRKNALQSTGHGRSSFVGGASTAIGNLFIQPKEGKSYEELKQELIRTCRLQTLPYGVIIKTLSNRGGGKNLSDPVLAYRVWVEDGREELIRGLNPGELTLKDLRQIQAVGNDHYVYNQIEGTSRQGGGIATSIVAPSVLIEELELRKPTGTQLKPLMLTHPFFNQ
jgi:predicted Zn-dependent protease